MTEGNSTPVDPSKNVDQRLETHNFYEFRFPGSALDEALGSLLKKPSEAAAQQIAGAINGIGGLLAAKLRDRTRERNLRGHFASANERIPKECEPNEAALAQWIESAQDIDHEDDVLASAWQEVLVKVYLNEDGCHDDVRALKGLSRDATLSLSKWSSGDLITCQDREVAGELIEKRIASHDISGFARLFLGTFIAAIVIFICLRVLVLSVWRYSPNGASFSDAALNQFASYIPYVIVLSLLAAWFIRSLPGRLKTVRLSARGRRLVRGVGRRP